MKRTFVFASTLALASCAGVKGGSDSQSQAVTNLVPYDISACFAKKVEAPKPANDDIMAGYWLTVRPKARECLTDPKSRAGDPVKVTVDTVVSDTGMSSTVTGTNLTPDGQKCIENVLAQGPQLAALPKGDQKVSFKGELNHKDGQDPTVKTGVNEPSDMAALIRLAEPTWCGCFESVKDVAPKPFTAHLSVTKPEIDSDKKNMDVKISFMPYGATVKAAEAPKAAGYNPRAGGGSSSTEESETAAGPASQALGDPATEQVASCMKDKIAALPFVVQKSGHSVEFDYPVLLLNSRANQDVAGGSTSFQLQQMDTVRGLRQAKSAFKLGARTNATHVYEAALKKYQTNYRSVKLAELRTKCNAIVKTDADYSDAIKDELDIDTRTVNFLTTAMATDARWAPVKESAEKQLATTQRNIQSASSAATADKANCAKI